MQISIQGVNGKYSDAEEIVAESVEEKTVEEGPVIVSYPLNISMASQVKLVLHFSSKWILLSEVFFHTKAAVGEIEQFKKGIASKTFAKDESENMRQDMPIDDLNIVEDDSTNDLERKPILHEQNSDFKQTYIGIGIGILSIAIIMLMVIIYLILRKNRHQIFSKHSSKFCFISSYFLKFVSCYQYSRAP